jgi:DNA-binding transcriptional MerR regulator
MNRPISYPLQSDRTALTGRRTFSFKYLQTRARINALINHYLAIELLSDRLSDLPNQFTYPHQRPWEPIHWNGIHPSQIIGVDPDLFLQIIANATEIEAPIRAYSKESRDYLQTIHPQMAYFLGGDYDTDGSTLVVGVWEKEERQHAPTFSKIYHQLTDKKLQLKPNSVSNYQSCDDPYRAACRHLLSRITTEWSATSVYLWLMAHSTGELQRVIAQPLQDEVNHLAKFWGFSRWAFAHSYLQQLSGSSRNLVSLIQHHKDERTQGDDFLHETLKLSQIPRVAELGFTFMRVMVRLRAWNRELSPSYLRHLFGTSPQMSVIQNPKSKII